MNDKSANPFSLGQIKADLFMASAAIQKAESMSSKAGKFYRGTGELSSSTGCRKTY